MARTPARTTARSPRWLAAWRRRALARMARSRAATLRLLARIPEEAILRPRTLGDWSIENVLTHIAAWEEEGTRRLALIARGRGDRIVWYDTMAEVDRFNARAVRPARRMSLAATLRRLAHARAALLRALKWLPPRVLADPAHDLPVMTWLREFAWAHETDHRQEIREWWRGQRAGWRPASAKGGR